MFEIDTWSKVLCYLLLMFCRRTPKIMGTFFYRVGKINLDWSSYMFKPFMIPFRNILAPYSETFSTAILTTGTVTSGMESASSSKNIFFIITLHSKHSTSSGQKKKSPPLNDAIKSNSVFSSNSDIMVETHRWWNIIWSGGGPSHAAARSPPRHLLIFC